MCISSSIRHCGITIGVLFWMIGCAASNSQQTPPATPAANCTSWDDWSKPTAPFQLVANTYYVGTCGITVLLIATAEGHVVIDGGPPGAGAQIASNIETLGFKLDDVRYLLHSHEHYDHVGGLAYLQSITDATVVATQNSAPVLRSGVLANDDPQFGMHAPFAPVSVGQVVQSGDVIRVGDLAITALQTPGHTPGAVSWHWRACERADCANVAYLDSLSPISREGFRFGENTLSLQAFRRGLTAAAELPCDVLLTPHPSASRMISRLNSKAGLYDKSACRTYARRIGDRLDSRLAKEAAATD
ncbi:MAG: subclass B3 metallo-beta-lactamase [Pseudomonadota bacterium]